MDEREVLRHPVGRPLQEADLALLVDVDPEVELAAADRVEVAGDAMSPLELKRFLHALEDRHGRIRDVPKFSDRTLDIDILLYDDLYLISPELEIPREEILTAAHVLKPLADLAPKLLHPVSRRTMAELWDDFPPQESHLVCIEL
ncbi:MAG: 2-amino-4-hydroxy-6-hydroxymethyldihydropteridine diphosphokinase [Xanthomonadales bacterium]|nr:2-amino-4-hydroxy-6-hydroxymethyldihydropteridine diphosphokinase [Xanthomonadales bacterium]